MSCNVIGGPSCLLAVGEKPCAGQRGSGYNSLPFRFQGIDVHFAQHQETSFNLGAGTVPHLKAFSQLIQDH